MVEFLEKFSVAKALIPCLSWILLHIMVVNAKQFTVVIKTPVMFVCWERIISPEVSAVLACLTDDFGMLLGISMTNLLEVRLVCLMRITGRGEGVLAVAVHLMECCWHVCDILICVNFISIFFSIFFSNFFFEKKIHTYK